MLTVVTTTLLYGWAGGGGVEISGITFPRPSESGEGRGGGEAVERGGSEAAGEPWG